MSQMDRATRGTLCTTKDRDTALFAAPASSIRRGRNKQSTVVVFIDLLTALTRPAAVTKFSKPSILDKVPEGSTLIFGVTRISLKHSVGQVEGSIDAKNQLNPSNRLSRTPTYVGHTDKHTDRHMATAYTGASIGLSSRGQN